MNSLGIVRAVERFKKLKIKCSKMFTANQTYYGIQLSNWQTCLLGKSMVKTLPANARTTGDLGSIPGLKRFSREENGYPLQYSHLENSMDWGAWWATVHGVTELDTAEWLTLSLLSLHSLFQLLKVMWQFSHLPSCLLIMKNKTF